MKKVYKKVNVLDYIETLKKDFEKFRNIEKLIIIDEVLDSDNQIFVCKNQNGKLIPKSLSEIESEYKKLKNGSLVPVDKIVFAVKTLENIEFSTSLGEHSKLKIGDYIVIHNEIIMGMKKEDFEENYKQVVSKKVKENLLVLE